MKTNYRKYTIHLVAAARPNFMKIAPLYHCLAKQDWAETLIVHTGQHYDLNMSDAFFQDFSLPPPHIHLSIGGGSHAEQTGQILMAYEKILMEKRPDMVIVVGDVNSTLACTLAAVKISYHITNSHGEKNKQNNKRNNNREGNPDRDWTPLRPIIAHLEAGLRSFDRTMPEEINRIVTDSLADILWTPSPDGDKNLFNEGIARNKISRVGNIMIDALEMLRKKIESKEVYLQHGLEKSNYGVVTLHRPSNVDNYETLKELCGVIKRISQKITLIFPIHPRTRKKLLEYQLMSAIEQETNIIISDPLNYISFMSLVFNCKMVITDSGGIQEETSYLGIPCLTMRPNTERPITIEQGTNELCTLSTLEKSVDNIISGNYKKSRTLELWDGKTAERVAESIKVLLGLG